MPNQILGQEVNSTLGNHGITTDNVPSLIVSKLHKEYSINGNPNIPNKPQPSALDWNGQKPTIPGKFPYLDNLPG